MSLFQCQAIRVQMRELIPAQSSPSCTISAPPLSPDTADTAARGTCGGATTGTAAK